MMFTNRTKMSIVIHHSQCGRGMNTSLLRLAWNWAEIAFVENVGNVCTLQGGFAKCYELTDVKTNKTYAGKIIAKARIVKSSQREKVGFVGYW